MATPQIAIQPVATPPKPKTTRTPKTGFRCPECGSAEAYRSQRRNWLEKMMCWYRRVLPYRCRKCDQRFYSRKPS